MSTPHETIAFGRTAEVFALGNHSVLKLFREGMPSVSVEEEFLVSQSVYQTGIPMPKPIRKLEQSGRLGIEYERITGTTMLRRIAKKPWTLKQEAARMARLHAEIHQKSCSELPSQKQMLRTKLAEVPMLTGEEKVKIVKHLDGLTEDTKICHGDFHPDNIIIGDAEWVIDWMTGVSGNPAGDAARTLLLLRYGELPNETPKLVAKVITYLRERLLKHYLKVYLRITNRTIDEIEQWLVPVAAARLIEWIPDVEKQALVHMIRLRLAGNGLHKD